jgi:hypothetical protein
MKNVSGETHELAERSEEAHRDSRLTPVALSMSVVAVAVALVSLLGHRAHTKEVLLQDKAGDQWAYYEAEKATVQGYKTSADILSSVEAKDPAHSQKLQEEYAQEIRTHEDNQKKYEDKALSLESGVTYEEHISDRLDLAEVCLEAALVIMSVTLLTRRRVYWKFGMILACLGVVAALTSFLVH